MPTKSVERYMTINYYKQSFIQNLIQRLDTYISFINKKPHQPKGLYQYIIVYEKQNAVIINNNKVIYIALNSSGKMF